MTPYLISMTLPLRLTLGSFGCKMNQKHHDTEHDIWHKSQTYSPKMSYWNINILPELLGAPMEQKLS
jgi:hypothetical protein